jgi:tetratricopeptide (TPR) repeat protein
VFLAPVLQIVPNLTWVAERYLYIPAIGAFVLVGKLFFHVWDRLPRVWLRWSWEAAMVSALLLLVWRTETYLPAFRNNLTLWEATAKTCPTSAICHAGLGTALLEENQIERGMNELIRAVEFRPTPENLGRLGDAYTLNARDYRQAVIAYNMALEKGGASSATYSAVELYAKLARAHLMSGNLEEAGKAVEAGRAVQPNDPYLLIVSSFYESSRGNREAALDALRRALSATGLNSGIPALIHTYWGNAADVGRLIAYLNARPNKEP